MHGARFDGRMEFGNTNVDAAKTTWCSGDHHGMPMTGKRARGYSLWLAMKRVDEWSKSGKQRWFGNTGMYRFDC
jgi:hypothetical protein